MRDTADELLERERHLALGRGPEYEEALAQDCLVIVPGDVLDKPRCVAAMDASPGWDRVELTEPRAIMTEDTVTLVYRFVGDRAETRYRATLSSTYVRREGVWRLLVHQHTPD